MRDSKIKSLSADFRDRLLSSIQGFPSVGKSTLLSLITKTASETASYEFTTLTAIPGVIEYEGARIQLLDLPGIVEGASQGRGRGRQVVSVAKTADLVRSSPLAPLPLLSLSLASVSCSHKVQRVDRGSDPPLLFLRPQIIMMLDATKQTQQRALLEIELEAVGIRLNRSKPDVVVKPKAAGGITVRSLRSPSSISRFDSLEMLTREGPRRLLDQRHDKADKD